VRILKAAAEQNAWPLHLAVCARPDAPAVPPLTAAADTVAVTSLREGFGLVYNEAAAVSRPLLARIPGRLEGTLSAVGFRFHSGWRKILVPDHLYDGEAEMIRVTTGRERLRTLLPSCLHASLEMPVPRSGNVDFGQLSLRAQIEVLSGSPEVTRKACLPLNPALTLPREPQPPAREWWSPARWAETMLRHARASASCGLLADWQQRAEPFIAPLVREWLLFPLLWETESSALPQP
ncbi:MAG TPA: hypothetical protein VHM91_06325, partial [Verrucomicrobiales bacterium]|nr:hypothetical protein [Verrucomicrobiales bacterium]